MGTRGYWLPPGHENLTACDGFYVDCDAVYKTGDIDADWQKFLDDCCKSLTHTDPSLQKVCDWRPYALGERRFILVRNDKVDYIAEAADGYVAVYVIIPEDCDSPGYAKRSFDKHMRNLHGFLTLSYPGHVSRRQSAWKVKQVG